MPALGVGTGTSSTTALPSRIFWRSCFIVFNGSLLELGFIVGKYNAYQKEDIKMKIAIFSVKEKLKY
jgi:hypothetical protein